MGISHDLAFLDFTIFLKESGHFCFGETRVNSSDKEVRAWVDGTIFVLAIIVLWGTIVKLRMSVGGISRKIGRMHIWSRVANR